MSQRELAIRCEEAGVPVSDSQLSKIERGLCVPYPALRATLAHLLSLDVSVFEATASTKAAS